MAAREGRLVGRIYVRKHWLVTTTAQEARSLGGMGGRAGERDRSDLTRIHAYMRYMYVHMYAHTHAHTYICMYTCTRTYRICAHLYVYLNIRAYIFNTHVYAGVYKYAHTYEDVSRAHTRVRRQWSGRAGIGWRSRLRASKYGTVSAVHS